MASNLSNRPYVRFSSGVSKVPAGEAEDIQAIKDMFSELVAGDWGKHGHSYPVTHAKTQGLIKGKLIIPDDLPSHLKQGMFATAGEYPVVLRYSNNNHDVGTDDRKSPSRGLSLKIFNVNGPRFPEGAGITTQDFEFNSDLTRAELWSSKAARDMIGILMKAMTDPKGAYGEIVKRPDVELQTSGLKFPNVHLETLPFFSQVPYRFGDYVAKYSLVPTSRAQKALAGVTVPADATSPMQMTDWLREYFAANEAEYEWRFQLLEDLNEQPVEDASKEWSSTKYPFQTVARLVFPKQDPMNYELKAYWEDHLRSNSWLGLKDHEPLGSTNRVRWELYPHARDLRAKFNGRAVIDPQSIEELPGPLPPGVPTGKSQSWLSYLWSWLPGGN